MKFYNNNIAKWLNGIVPILFTKILHNTAKQEAFNTMQKWNKFKKA